MQPLNRPSEIKALSGARAFPPLILVLFHFCEGQGYRGVDLPVCHQSAWTALFTCSKWFDLVVAHGYLWVEFFFALSGFILIHVYGERAREFWRGKAYLPFLGARLARLYPVHFVMLLTMLVLMWALNGIETLGGPVSIFHRPYPPINDLPSFVANLFLVQAWNAFPYLTWNGASWFVSIEFFLCVIFPVFVLLARGGLLRAAALIGAGLSGLVFLANVTGHGLDITFHDSFLRGMAGFSVGAGMAMLFRAASEAGAEKIPVWVHDAVQAALLGFFLWATYFTGWPHGPNDVWFALSLYLLIFALAFDKGFLARALSTRLPMKLGEWSYAIYMGQIFWLQIVRNFEPVYLPPFGVQVGGIWLNDVVWWVEPMVVLLLCIGWGALLAIFVEQPANKWLRALMAPRRDGTAATGQC